jgi:lysosomal alpha-mannosidase
LNETAFGEGLVARGKHWLIFGKHNEQSPTLAARERLLQNQVLMSNWLFFDEASTLGFSDWQTKFVNEVS